MQITPQEAREGLRIVQELESLIRRGTWRVEDHRAVQVALEQLGQGLAVCQAVAKGPEVGEVGGGAQGASREDEGLGPCDGSCEAGKCPNLGYKPEPDDACGLADCPSCYSGPRGGAGQAPNGLGGDCG
jgi:hypothetical protein